MNKEDSWHIHATILGPYLWLFRAGRIAIAYLLAKWYAEHSMAVATATVKATQLQNLALGPAGGRKLR